MNKRKLRRVAIVALVLVLLCNTLGVQASTKKDDPTVIVKDYGSLYTAIAEAKDNDVIGIQGTITIPAIVDLNMSENKAVILRRMEAGAKLVVSGDYGADNKASFRMISFDGNSTGVGGTEPFVEINGNAYFSMCDFKECFNQSDNGGAINISSGEVELNSCSFDENSASYGSHIFNSGTLLVNSCTLKGGWADEMGGAIYNRGTLTVKGTEIKENNARIGGGIYNNSSLEVDNSLIWSNTATVQGTDIANEGTYTNSTTEEQYDSWLDYYKLYYAGWEDDTNTSVGGSGDYLKFLTATEKPTKPDPTEPVDPEPTEPSTPDPVTPPSGGDEGKTDPESTAIADKNINIEAKGVDVKLEITGDSYNISISATEGQESQIQPVNEVSTVNAPESTTEPQRSPNWIEYITVILLAVLVGLEIKDKLHKEK